MVHFQRLPAINNSTALNAKDIYQAEDLEQVFH